jgi:hypothetical protein
VTAAGAAAQRGHAEGSRGSAGCSRRRELLHGCHDPFPTVAHVREVLTATAAG